LVEQAERIARGQPALTPSTAALPERLYPPTHNVSATAAEQKSFVVQVGAYSSQAEALRRLHAMQSRANDLLGGRSPVSQPVQHGGKQLYRARFSGFDQQSAASTCQELKRRQIDCHVARIE
jgi:D-alanyl-D-alanine carboxypeptidase